MEPTALMVAPFMDDGRITGRMPSAETDLFRARFALGCNLQLQRVFAAAANVQGGVNAHIWVSKLTIAQQMDAIRRPHVI